MEVITNYQSYGFETASMACWGNGGRYAGIVPCGPTSSMCDDRRSHVFWEPYHPSESANLVAGQVHRRRRQQVHISNEPEKAALPLAQPHLPDDEIRSPTC